MKPTLCSRAVIILKKLKNNAYLSFRKLSRQIAIPKSSVHRQRRAQEARMLSVGHSFFETEEGVAWLGRLFFATLFIFGIQANVGAETIGLFFSLLLLTAYVPTSASSLRDVKNKIRIVIEQFGKTQMANMMRCCENKELHLGGDETAFGSDVFLILMELTSGFILTEALVEDRKYATWWQEVSTLFSALKKIISFTSDGGRALIALGKKKLCNNVMDLFHMLQDVKRVFATKFHSKRRTLWSQFKKLTDKKISLEDQNKQAIATIDTQLALLDKGQQEYRNTLFTVSTQAHPYQAITTLHTSQELKDTLYQQLILLRNITKECDIADKNNLLDRFERRIAPLSQLNDLWHAWVDQSLLCKTQDPQIIKWAKYVLLPSVYWKEQVRKSRRKKTLKNYYADKEEKAKQALDAHPYTHKHITDDWLCWAKAMALKYQRTTSAIEGRNARLSHYYFTARGVKSSHVGSLTTLHNFWIKREDNTTAAERLCGFKPPDLFEFVLQNMAAIPLPRMRNQNNSTLMQQGLSLAA